MVTVRIVPTDETYVEALHHTLDAVARERRYLAFVEGPPLEGVRAFVRALIAGAGVQFLAIQDADTVIGWCDIFRNPREGFRHCGQLGMGLLPHARGRGLGARLATAAIGRAWADGLERIELEVFASNERAVGLYRTLGFSVEGVKRRARMLDGRDDDIVLMALMRDRLVGYRLV
ncbi:MAG: N-acetyltransferase family protein [Gemmatimonas sp.]|nr:GNAT family protein [Gemmatimonadaceae bacterium]